MKSIQLMSPGAYFPRCIYSFYENEGWYLLSAGVNHKMFYIQADYRKLPL